jgi:hypothetical protein
MKIINSQEIDKENIFLCFSPPLAKFLVEVKGIEFIDIQFSEKNNKKIWVFCRSNILNNALLEWTERGKTGNKIY